MTSLDYIKLGLPQIGIFTPQKITVVSDSIYLGPDQGGGLLIPAGPGYTIYSLKASFPSWVRIYSSLNARTADVASGRGKLEDPDAGSGVIVEILTNATNQKVEFAPAINGYVNDAPVNGIVYLPVYVVNNYYTASNINVEVTMIKTENI
jgi:hypothetical protein